MSRCLPVYPTHTVHWKTRVGELLQDFLCRTDIEGYPAQTDFISVSDAGQMELANGYVWDFGSGPAIDTPEMIKASLVHDAWYELMTLGLVPWSVKKKADKLLRTMLLESGSSRLRAWYVYWAVRAFGGRKARRLSNAN